MAMVAMGSGHADPVTKQDVSDKILDYIVEQLKPQPDGSHAVCVCVCVLVHRKHRDECSCKNKLKHIIHQRSRTTKCHVLQVIKKWRCGWSRNGYFNACFCMTAPPGPATALQTHCEISPHLPTLSRRLLCTQVRSLPIEILDARSTRQVQARRGDLAGCTYSGRVPP